jgi:hypothetical protein
MSLSRTFALAKVKCLEFYTHCIEDYGNGTKSISRKDTEWLIGNLKPKNDWKPSRILPLFVDASITGWSAIYIYMD